MRARGEYMTQLAEFSMEFKAQLVAESLREQGIVAHVASADFTTVYGMGRWGVWVPRSEMERARGVMQEIGEAAWAAGMNPTECPECLYDLSGLTKPEKCPECGHELGPYRGAEARPLPPGMVRRALPGVLIAGVALVGLVVLSQTNAEWMVGAAVVAFVVAAVVLNRRRVRRRREGGGGEMAKGPLE